MRLLALDHRTALTSDTLALLAFVTVGLVSHHGGLSAAGYARDALPIVGCWLLAAGASDLYRRPRPRALLATWLGGVTGGVLVRALAVRRLDGDDAVFLGVALCFTLAFVLAFRAAATLRTRLDS
ncbi:MAG TPA: DUF3054 domain-containing protein [Gaiellaceae bacterium]|nr:DUF3054 domain-containing protein [Gaiellaceae bacterium]